MSAEIFIDWRSNQEFILERLHVRQKVNYVIFWGTFCAFQKQRALYRGLLSDCLFFFSFLYFVVRVLCRRK